MVISTKISKSVFIKSSNSTQTKVLT